MSTTKTKFDREHETRRIAFCEDCGKSAYATSKGAKKAGRKMSGRNKKRGHINGFQCPHREGWYHFGHLPTSVARGTLPKSVLVPHG